MANPLGSGQSTWAYSNEFQLSLPKPLQLHSGWACLPLLSHSIGSACMLLAFVKAVDAINWVQLLGSVIELTSICSHVPPPLFSVVCGSCTDIDFIIVTYLDTRPVP